MKNFFDFSKFIPKGVSDFSHKKGAVGKIGRVVIKKGEYHLFSY